MAGRIRSIKPEVLEDSRSAALSSPAWRAWVSIWLLADDFGRVRGESRRLAASLFWSCPDKIDIEKVLAELQFAGMLRGYMVRGQMYYEVNNWAKHQRIDNASKRGTLPGPEEADEPVKEPLAASLRESPRVSAVRGSYLDLEGNRKGREGKGGAANAAAAVSVLEVLNTARKKAIPGARAIGANKASLEHIEARLKDGYTEDDCRHVIDVCAAEVRKDPSTAKWFNTVSPFRKDNFARKLGGDVDSMAGNNRTHGNYAPRAAVAVGGDVTEEWTK